MDLRLRGDDEKISSAIYYDFIKKTKQKKTPVSHLILRVAVAAGARGNAPAH
jgi:hypothetical protein